MEAKVDSGAGGNILPVWIFKVMYPDKLDSDSKLTTKNWGSVKCYGALQVYTEWDLLRGPPKYTKAVWYVDNTQGPALLGLPSSKRLGIIMVNCKPTKAILVKPMRIATITNAEEPVKHIKSTDDLVAEYPDWFEENGKFSSEYKIYLMEDTEPKIHPPQKCLIAICPLVKAELDKMVTLSVITPVDEPTDWVSSLAYACKASGVIYLCLDLRDLNKWIHCDHYCIPTIEKINHKFAGLKFFIKLDRK